MSIRAFAAISCRRNRRSCAYSSRSNETIASHIDQSHRGNIDFWALSSWGPQSTENTTIRTSILNDPRSAELRYAIHYESTGRLGT